MTEPDSKDDEKELVGEWVPIHGLSRLRFSCPHCGSYMKVRTSKAHLPTYSELYLHCANEFGCGFRCKSGLGILETIAPSYQPNPNINIKLSPWLKRQVKLEEEGQMRLGIEDLSQSKRNQNERNAH